VFKSPIFKNDIVITKMGKKVTFCTYDAPLFHSVNSWLKRLLPGLSLNGFSISILVFYEGPLEDCETYKFFVDLGFRVKTFPFKSIAEEKIRWMLETLSEDPPDIFVPNMLVHAFFAASWLKRAGIPTIGVIHSDEQFYDGLVDVFVNGKQEFKVSAVVAVSRYLFNRINSQKPDEVVCRCIPCGVPISNVPVTSFTNPVFKLIYIGRLAEQQKRISEVVKAMCNASNKIEGVEGIIYGHGEDKKVISLIKRYRAETKVKFGGSLSNKEIFNTLSKAQAFVLLSDYEGLPQSLLEAMACGLVPVCSDIKSGIPELVIPNQTGVIVKDSDSSFVKAIQTLKDDPAFCQEISNNVKQKVIGYSMEVCTESWVNLLNEMLINADITKPIEIPATFELPKPHRDLKREDFRTPTISDNFLHAVRKTKIFHFVKKLLSPN